MKKLFALFLAACILLSLAACKNDAPTTSTAASQPTSSAPEQSDPAPSTPDASAPGASDGGHTHNHSAAITTEATCEADGVMTFTCTCGDSYTQTIRATGHTWTEWTVVETPTVSSMGKAQRKCTACSATESEDLDQLALPFGNEFNGGNALAVSCLSSSGMTTDGILNFCSYEIFHSYIYEHALSNALPEQYKITVGQQDFYFNQYAVPEDVVISIIESRFLLMEDFWYDMLRSSDRYDSATQTFRCTDPIWFTGYDAAIVAYEHLEGDDYQLYLESRVNNHPHGACSDCATTDSCVISRVLLSVTVCARAGYSPIIISYGTIQAVPDSATPLN